MKKYFGLLYWAVMIVAVSLILKSVMGSFGLSFFLSVMLLPGVLFFKYFAGGISFKNRRQGILHTIYFVAVVMLIEYMGIIFFYWNVYDYPFNLEMPRIVTNPLFIWFILGALLSLEWFLKTKFFTDDSPAEKYVTFTSVRKKISLEPDSILYIESRDYEVIVMTVQGNAYPTRMKISQWESVLDSRFVRTHRSFIVNREHITRFDSRAVWLGDIPIEISRKYRETVADKLEKASG